MIKVRHALERGHVNHGWLDSYHTFSFANYYDSEHMGFRSLRVINEDRVRSGQGFPTHSHRDFEIISYVVSGALRHRDSLGHTAVMRTGDVQRISAGTGISHSEYNDSNTETVHFLQIWLAPRKNGGDPDYAQASFSDLPPSRLTLACSSDGRAGSIRINQDADLYIGRFEPGNEVIHPIEGLKGVWVQVIDGNIDVNGEALTAGDAASLEGEKEAILATVQGAHILLFDLV
jgi:redox-sensitive bicupin YhaK (pirin superfamily)